MNERTGNGPVVACRVEDVPVGGCLPAAEDGVLLARIDGRVVAWENRCLHRDTPLHDGAVRDGVLTCPEHFWRYDLATGCNADRPARPALIWDMGGILYRYFTEVMLAMAPTHGWDLAGVPLGPTGGMHDPAYDRMLRGDIDEHDYLAEVRERLRRAGIDADPVTAIDWEGHERTEVWALIAAAHEAGHPQAVLSNDATRWLGARWWDTWEPAPWFDTMIDVATLPERKPAAGPYLAAADSLGVTPEECLFVDDLPVNCDGAEAVGMASHLVDVRDPVGSMERLAKRIDLDVS